MESAPAPAHIPPPIEAAVLAAAAKEAAAAAPPDGDPGASIDAVVQTLSGALSSLFVSVFMLEHGRLWLVAQRGYAVVPDGIATETGILGRALRLGRTQLVADVTRDPDYVPVMPAVRSELALPLVVDGVAVGALNVESTRPLPDEAERLAGPLADALAPLVEELRAARMLDLGALARLFVHLGSLRDPDEIASLAAASLPRVLPVEASQVVLWDELGSPVELASWRVRPSGRAPLTVAELEGARALASPTVVCQLLASGRRTAAHGGGSVAWLPLRANGEELGVLVGVSGSRTEADSAQLDAAAVLAAHVAASLDAAVSLRRERQSAVTDSLTGIRNRRGLEELLEGALGEAQEARVPLSLIVIDCDNFKEINDRAGHEFGDALLVEVAEALTRSLPAGTEAARLGGDEFVVMLPGHGADAAVAVGSMIRSVLADGLTDAGFPLRISAGISTFPFDGATATALVRAADQALYAAKGAGKDRVASFRDVLRHVTSAPPATPSGPDRRGTARSAGSILSEALDAAAAIEAEETAEEVCSRLCKALVFVIGATGSSASRVVGSYVIDATSHTLRELSLGAEAAYRISDFPLTAEALRTGEARAISFLDDDVDPAEAFILRELGMNALLMVPIVVEGRPWGLVELFEMRLRRFTVDDVAVARFLVSQAERRLGELGATPSQGGRPPVYELPPDASPRRGPSTR
jgi:diguanylate cyclase (GGDEF)-like protein